MIAFTGAKVPVISQLPLLVIAAKAGTHFDVASASCDSSKIKMGSRLRGNDEAFLFWRDCRLPTSLTTPYGTN